MDERLRADHDRRVNLVAAQVRELAGSRAAAHVDKGGVHHVVPLPAGDRRFAGRRVDVSALRHVLEVDVERRRCVAEPGVTFADLLGGIKTLISRNHYTEDRFWRIYNEANYRTAKARLDPNGVFRDLYEKLHRVG